MAIDLTAALQMKDESLSLFDPEEGDKALDWRAGEYPKRGNAVIGADPSDPQLTIEARGGHDLIYLPERFSKREGRHFASLVVNTLLEQDYTAGLFVNEQRVGHVRGALPMTLIGWERRSTTRVPEIIREGGREASAGERAGQPLSRVSIKVPSADTVGNVEGNTTRCVIASTSLARRGRRTWHAQTLSAREPGDLQLGRPLNAVGPHWEGEEP